MSTEHKYITLENLQTFVNELKNGSYTATNNTFGGIKIGYEKNDEEKNYPVKLTNDGKAYVNVPWSSTSTENDYDLPTASDNVLGGIKTGYTQNGKNYPVKVDDNDNAFVQVTLPTATASDLGGIKVANVRTTTITPRVVDTTGSYCGVELDSSGKAFVNIPVPVTIQNMNTSNTQILMRNMCMSWSSLPVITINQIVPPLENESATYSALILNGYIKFESISNLYWANGSQPPATAGIYEIIITGYNMGGAVIYMGTWASYSK